MKITDAVFFTDNEVVRIETTNGNFYLTNKNKIYNMHPINVMAEEVSKDSATQVRKLVKEGKYKNADDVKKWV